MISYEPLWKTMKEKNVSQYRLLKSGIDTKTLDSLRKNKNINTVTIEKLCNIIGCTPNDILEFLPEEKK
ncbi:MAG: helix-turn-helix transcriptional regulator [Erysipelotrichaceae bacterium]|nr:helix-turn-helix transcriptional regulator [Erysipelotrichaceae bacterium]